MTLVSTPKQDAGTEGALYQALLDTDSRTVPDVYRWQAPFGPEQLRVPVERYTSADFHKLEVEKLWKRV